MNRSFDKGIGQHFSQNSLKKDFDRSMKPEREQKKKSNAFINEVEKLSLKLHKQLFSK